MALNVIYFDPPRIVAYNRVNLLAGQDGLAHLAQYLLTGRSKFSLGYESIEFLNRQLFVPQWAKLPQRHNVCTVPLRNL